MYYITLGAPEDSIARIQIRVSEGGHFVPDDIVRRRYERSRNLFEEKYKALVDHWMLYDNSGDVPNLIDERL